MLIGMTEAAKRLGVTTRQGALKALRNGGVPVVEFHPRAYGVEETDLNAFLPRRRRPGRPRKRGELNENLGALQTTRRLPTQRRVTFGQGLL